jgi:hypoxanthine phosphoribosyltransferase
MHAAEDFRTVLAQADLLHDTATIDAAIAAMATRVDDDFRDLGTGVFLTVMQGGLFFAASLGMRLRGDFEFDYVHATRYRGTNGGEISWIARPRISLAGRHVLVVDDILDEGPTLAAIRDECRHAGAASVRIAVLADKAHARRAPGIDADYIGLTVPDRYVFGYGMDWHGHGRNLPAIYAMAEPA